MGKIVIGADEIKGLTYFKYYLSMLIISGKWNGGTK